MNRIRWVKLNAIAGFTLVETTVVLAIIGLLTVILVSGSGPQIKNERFAGQVRVFADELRRAQTQSYTVKTGTCPAGATCYWRGNLMILTQQNLADPIEASYPLNLLTGDDYSKYTTATGQTMGVTGKQAVQTSSLSGIRLTAISIVGQPALTDGTAVSQAFLAPDGKGYVCSAVASDTTTCDVASSGLNNYLSRAVKFTLSDTATKLVSDVTYDPATGSITITTP